MSDLRQIGKIIEDALQNTNILENANELMLFKDWQEIVGETIAAYAHPVRLDNGELILVIEDPVWRTEIFNIREVLIKTINERMGERIIKKIRIY